MKKQRISKLTKLTLNTETLRHLTNIELSAVPGADGDVGPVIVVQPSTPQTCVASCGLKCM